MLFGANFLPGIIYLQIMAFMPFVSGLNNLISVQGLLNMKMDRQYLYITISTFMLSIILNVSLVPKFHGLATSFIQLICEIFTVVIAGICLFRAQKS
ncbi:MAG: hypothetical protein ACKO96_45545, partial [Flammeovirgaceae bacterium]